MSKPKVKVFTIPRDNSGFELAAVYEETENNFSGHIPGYPGCVATGKTLEELKKNLTEAYRLHVEGLNRK